MLKKRPYTVTMAICYDFDGTLAPGNMQEYGFIEKLNMTPETFWKKSNTLAKTQKVDNILAYMYQMKKEAEKINLPFTKKDLTEYASKVQLFPGVEEWFPRMNAYALTKGIILEHYIISSGLNEMVEGTKIAPFFKGIFASSFMYDANGNALWPALVVNYTNKTQFLYRINKGCLDVGDDASLNAHMDDEDKPIPFENMIYIGDGDTDIPSMKTVKREGGHTIAVFQKKDQEKIKSFLGVDRADIIAAADYRENEKIDIFVKSVIDKILTDTHLKYLQGEINQGDKKCKL